MAAPTSKAFRFVIDGQNQQYDAYLDLISLGTKYIECRYKATSDTSDNWIYLIAPDVLLVSTTQETDATFDAAIAIINTEIATVFGTAGNDIPLLGFERIEWLIQVGLKEVGNVISRI